MHRSVISGLMLLAACGAPSPHFHGIAPRQVTVEGSLFEVRRRGNLAEAIRLSPEYAPRLGPIEDRARRAMALATGCHVEWVLGDQALLLGRLDCARNPETAY